MPKHESHIKTLDDLRTHVQRALQLEHATIPPYFTALSSIKPDTNTESVDVIRSVLIEEMLHMALAANVLNAIGGSPVLDDADFVPAYPTPLPHSDQSFTVSLARFSPETVETFLKIERPEAPHAHAEADEWETIGQFYLSIEQALKGLCASLGEEEVFCGDRSRQITSEHLGFSGGRRVVPVYDLASALVAIDEIEEQGEGLKHAEVWDGDRDMFHPDREEVAHYFRFSQIMQGHSYVRGDSPQSGPSGESFNVDWDAVYPIGDNPRMADFEVDSPVRVKMLEFNLLYSDVLRRLQRGFNGEQFELNPAISEMMELRDRAHELMQLPSGDGTTTAGPSFEYVAKEEEAPEETPVFTISVRANGPYIVQGGVPLVRKEIVQSKQGESMTWRRDGVVETDLSYRLCRCGQSSHKPFCDGTHARVEFDGTETAPVEPSSARGTLFKAHNITLSDDEILCASAAFCHNRREGVWDMMKHDRDSSEITEFMHRVEACPSGRLVYELDGTEIEPDLPQEISVTKDGPYWVSGGIAVTMSDGRQLEVRNRVTLCRCGRSSIKPLCDGTHKDFGFTDG